MSWFWPLSITVVMLVLYIVSCFPLIILLQTVMTHSQAHCTASNEQNQISNDTKRNLNEKWHNDRVIAEEVEEELDILSNNLAVKPSNNTVFWIHQSCKIILQLFESVIEQTCNIILYWVSDSQNQLISAVWSRVDWSNFVFLHIIEILPNIC